LGSAVTRINQKLPPDKQVGATLEEVRAVPRKLQREVDKEAFTGLVQQSNEWDKARMNGVAAEHAGAWLEGVPCKALGLQLSSEEFRSRMGRRLGCDICDEHPCPLCYQVMDRFGAHAEGCMSGGDANLRHNENRDTIHAQCKLAGCRPELEKAKVLAGVLKERDLAGRRPADTLLRCRGGVKTKRGKRLPQVALDIGFVNPQAMAHLKEGAKETVGAAKDYTETKRKKDGTDDLCERAGIDYQPVVWETTGGVAPEAADTLRSLNRLVAVNTNTPLGEVARRFWQRVSVDLQRANHRAFVKRTVACTTSASQSSCVRFLRGPGADVDMMGT